MEKSWENFWTTGKVEDYLNYRNHISERMDDQAAASLDDTQKARNGERKAERHGTVGGFNGDGTFHHADF